MVTRAIALGALVLALLAATLGSSSLALGDDCAMPQGPRTGHMTVTPPGPVVTGTDLGLAVTWDDTYPDGLDPSSVKYQVNGTDLVTDRYGDAAYTPRTEGQLTISATWRYFPCANSSEPATGSTAPVTVDVTAGQRATGADFSKTVVARQKIYGGQQTVPGLVHLQFRAKCPPKQIASHEPIRFDLWWATGGKRATHSSQHAWSRLSDGCHPGGRFTDSTGHDSKLVTVIAQHGVSIVVREPARVDALIEMRSGDVLVTSKRAVFRPSRKGEGVTLKAP